MNGQYLIIPFDDSAPFTTDYWTAENCFVDGDLVIDLFNSLWTGDGENWHELKKDHL